MIDLIVGKFPVLKSRLSTMRYQFETTTNVFFKMAMTLKGLVGTTAYQLISGAVGRVSQVSSCNNTGQILNGPLFNICGEQS